MKFPQRKKGQTMVEYIIIVVLIAVTLIALVGLFGKAIAKKFSGAVSGIDNEHGEEAQQRYEEINADGKEQIRKLGASGEFE